MSVLDKIEIVLTDESVEVLKSFTNSVEKFCMAAEKLSTLLHEFKIPCLAVDEAPNGDDLVIVEGYWLAGTFTITKVVRRSKHIRE